MITRMGPYIAAVWPILLRKGFLNPSTRRAFSNKIIKSPSLLSLDLADSWPAYSKLYDHSKESSNTWDSNVIDGKGMADGIRARIASEVSQMKISTGTVPGLAVILVGERRDTQIYVRNKMVASEEVGIKYEMTAFPENCTESDVCSALDKYNEDPSIHGIIVQLPLPQHLDIAKILNSISLDKDVDGFHPLNMGNLALEGKEPLFIPCTPKGCIEMLLQHGVEIMGKRAVVIGRSNIVGLPTSLLLQRHRATVSVVNAHTENAEEISREADILVVAAGVPNLVRGSWLKPGAIVIDVGINPIEDPSSENGYRLIGDVCFEEATTIASAVTPVPGGVGPMTVAMLLLNTLESAKRLLNCENLEHLDLVRNCK